MRNAVYYMYGYKPPDDKLVSLKYVEENLIGIK
jgi:hypothetical protein